MAYREAAEKYDAFLYPYEGKRWGRINIYCKKSKLYIEFYDPSETLPPNTFNTALNIGSAYQSFSKFQHYLDLLRNERPIYVTFRPEDKPPHYVVFCAQEPPGEGEM